MYNREGWKKTEMNKKQVADVIKGDLPFRGL